MRRREFMAGLGAAAMWPLAAYSQQAEKTYRVSYLALLPGEDATLVKPFSQRLQELGYSAGRNLTMEYRSAEGRPERLAELAAELMQANPDVLVAGFGTLAAKAAAAATKTVPIVIHYCRRPLRRGSGCKPRQARCKCDWLDRSSQRHRRQAAANPCGPRPGKQKIAVLLNPDTPFSALALREVRSAAEQGQQPLAVFEARTVDQVSAGIEAAIKAGAAGLLTLDDPLLFGARRQIAELAAAARLPAIYGTRDFAEAGGLMSYGVDRRQISRRAAEYVDKVLKGARPADLPVEQPTKFEFVINLKIAKSLGLNVPPTMLALADEVIE